MVVGSFAKRSRKESVALSHSIRENLLDIKAQHKADKQVPVAYAWTGTEFWESGAQNGEGCPARKRGDRDGPYLDVAMGLYTYSNA